MAMIKNKDKISSGCFGIPEKKQIHNFTQKFNDAKFSDEVDFRSLFRFFFHESYDIFFYSLGAHTFGTPKRLSFLAPLPKMMMICAATSKTLTSIPNPKLSIVNQHLNRTT